jgi:hypothetical protein
MVALLLAVSPPLARADTAVLKGEDAELDVSGRVQLIGFAQHLSDPVMSDDRLYLFLKQGRLRTSGHYGDYAFQLELALGGESSISTQSGVSLALLDLSVDLPLHLLGKSYLRVGQFRVPFGREALLSDGNSLFVDRSIDQLGLKVGRDVGAAVTLRPGPATVIVGVFTGGGRDVPPQHYLPERLGVPLLVLRAGVGDTGQDPYRLSDEPLPTRKPGGAVFVNGFFTRDSTVGHSTVLNVKLADKSLLLNNNWNPYLGQTPLSQGDYWQLGADAAYRAPLGPVQVAAEVELDWGGYQNDLGVLHVAGGRVQAAVGKGAFEAGLRYAVLFPDAHFATGGVALTGDAPIHELTPLIAYRFPKYPVKLVADFPLLLQTPVFLEPHVGSYVGTELPDQAAVVAKGGTVSRQDVIEGRLMLQASF